MTAQRHAPARDFATRDSAMRDLVTRNSAAREFIVRDLTTGYRGRDVIRSLTLDPLHPGHITVLAGPNGAGKSTLLRALAGLLPATGTLQLDGTEIGTLGAEARADRLCFIPQSLPPGVALSVFETVLGALRVVGSGRDLSAKAAEARAFAALETVGIQAHALTPLDRLSGGERQLAGLAQALVRDPSVLLLDEPTSALDLRHQVVVMETVRRLAADGRIVIAVLHDLALAARWADRIVLLAKGRVVADGAPETAFTPELLADVYGVRARVERCSRGQLQVLVDGITDGVHQ